MYPRVSFVKYIIFYSFLISTKLDRNICYIFLDIVTLFLYNIYNLSFKEGTSIVDVPTHNQIKSNRDFKFLEHPFDAICYLVEYYWRLRG